MQMNENQARDRALTNAQCSVCGSSSYTQYTPGEVVS